ncbi:hypothetical protein SAMN05216480_103115 [Pustulibacterium marinum]|uniref:Peptidase MA superfamily protein n=1 Tax=Pustulibacterium marinum TaxID=1224947 RepID=A0A1I7G339_9FLAO|nr:hypothetical protein [Pustulibacterium marinum]SFU42849.1 hypothetical protein SAMN05216480_103115 [Pustulibacterium marinum]
MKLKCLLILFLGTLMLNAQQTIQPKITARVDTTDIQKKQVYQLYTNYLNSNIDSIYNNPYFKETNWKPELGTKDRSIFFLVDLPDDQTFLKSYPPKILQLDKIEEGRYQIKTLFDASGVPEQYQQFVPAAITKLYAVEQPDGSFLLENILEYDTQKWQHEQVGFINYVVSPFVTFDKTQAKEAVKFCKELAKEFGLGKVPEFNYYIANGSDEMQALLNFEYLMSYHTGLTDVFGRKLFTSYKSPFYKHELVHMLFPVKGLRPAIINEGFATWLGGPKQGIGYEESLLALSKQFQENRPLSLNEILNYEYKNKLDNNVLYVTGATICKLTYESYGTEGIWALLNSTPENYQQLLAKMNNQSFEEFSQYVLQYITDYAK